MKALRALLARPLRDQHPLVLAGLALAVVLAALAILTSGSNDGRRDGGSAPPTPAPAPVIGGDQPGAAQPAQAAAPAAARRAATVFVESYLPVLYGRAPASSLRGATGDVRRGLTASARPQRAPRDRTPRLAALELTPQTTRSALASATVDDGVAPRYRLIFTVELRGRRWLVTNLAGD